MSNILDRSVNMITPLTHMPFLARRGNRAVIVFGQSHEPSARVPRHGRTRIGRLWKLRLSEVSADELARVGLDVEKSTPIETGLQRNEVECSPCLFLSDSEAHLSFVGTIGHGTGPLRHRLYRMSGSDLTNLTAATLVSDEHCYCGFWRPDLTVTGDGDGVIRLSFNGGEERKVDTGFARIARVSYRADFPHHLLITGGDSPGLDVRMRTLVYDIKTEHAVGEILADGKPTYKPALYGALSLLPQEVPQAQRAWRLGVARQPQLVAVDRRFRRIR